MSNFTFKNEHFLLDGEPFQVISGAMHYWRIVPEYWEDRLKKLRACGFNTVETFVAWNLHERKEGVFDFSGNLDIVKYIEIAESLGLKVIVRPGPYICSEFDFGGLPSWLLAYPQMHLRCNDPMYLEKVRPYYRELLTRIRPHLCTNGGGIIMVQIENEYGSYGDDKEYLRAVASMYLEYGIDCQLFTSDGPCYWMLNGGTLPEYPSEAVLPRRSGCCRISAPDSLRCAESSGSAGSTTGEKSTTPAPPRKPCATSSRCSTWARR